MRRADEERPRTRPTRLMVAVLAALGFVVLAACSGAGDEDAAVGVDDASFEEPTAMTSVADEDGGEAEAIAAAAPLEDAEEPSDEAADDGVGDDAAEEAADGDESLGAGGTTSTPSAADLGRQLIFTARVEVEVDDVASASADATDIIEGLGGFVFGQQTIGGPEARSELTFKVLPDDFNRALEALGTVGELRNQTIETEDVTERIVDLESRIEVAELGVARLRAALEETTDLADYAEVERLLLERESDLEVMRGSLRTLQDQVDLATIVLVLTRDRLENNLEVTVSAYEGHDGGRSCPGATAGELEADQRATLCFDIVNVGDQTLTDLVLTESVLDIDGGTPLIEVFGSVEELAPGQSVLLAHEFRPERAAELRIRVVGLPTDGVSPEPAGPSVSTDRTFPVRTFEPESDPGFGDGFSAGVSILRGLWVAVTVVGGFLIPMMVFVPVIAAGWWVWRAWRRRRPGPPDDEPTGTPPPPPGTTPEPVGAGGPPTSA